LENELEGYFKTYSSQLRIQVLHKSICTKLRVYIALNYAHKNHFLHCN
jgi:hypothetical protein